MKRNKQEERLRDLRRMDKRLTGLRTESRQLDWVPVEEPQFIGWELRVGLSDAALRRQDSSDLVVVLQALHGYNETFTRYEWVAKLVRSQQGRYYQCKEAFLKRYCTSKRWYSYDDTWIIKHYFPYLEGRSLDQNEFELLTPKQRRYLESRKHGATVWRPEYYTYKIGTLFPKHDLIIRVTKAYSTHRGIPRSEAISERKKLDDYLTNAYYWEAKYGFHGGWPNVWEKTKDRRLTRKHWRSYLQEVSKIDLIMHDSWMIEEGWQQDPLDLLEKEEKRLLRYSSLIRE